MAKKISQLTEVTTPASTDVLAIVSGGITKKVQVANIGGAINIDVADLANATDGELITWDATGAPTTVAVGTAAQVLTSNGVGTAPTFQTAAGGGAWTLIGTSVASASASLTITGLDSTYDTYAFALSDIAPANDGAAARLRLGTSGGMVTSGYGYHQDENTFTSASYSATVSTSATHIACTTQSIGNATGEGLGVMGYIHAPGDGANVTMVTGTHTAGNTVGAQQTGCFAGSTQTVMTTDRVEFSFSTGNISRGRLTVWGISHA